MPCIRWGELEEALNSDFPGNRGYSQAYRARAFAILILFRREKRVIRESIFIDLVLV